MATFSAQLLALVTSIFIAISAYPTSAEGHFCFKSFGDTVTIAA
jgi:hypothetical protein